MVDLLLVDVLNPFSSFDVPFLLVDVVDEPLLTSIFGGQVCILISTLTSKILMCIFPMILLDVGR